MRKRRFDDGVIQSAFALIDMPTYIDFEATEKP